MRVGILSGAGYTGGELTRILLGHPKAKLTAVSSATYPGRPVHHAHPNLRGRTKISFVPEIDPTSVDCLFLAGGHGDSMKRVPGLLKKAGKLKIIDLSGDFRLADAALYPAWYGREHSAPDLLEGFAYGLSELNRKEIAKTALVANPGCFATAIALALAPLARAGVGGTAKVTAITGSSGSGAKTGPKTHHPVREGSLNAYRPLRHQHTPEIEQMLSRIPGAAGLKLAIVPVSGPLVRGIYAVCHLDLPQGMNETRLRSLYEETYRNCPFIRLHDEPPHLNSVTGSNFCDLYAAAVDGQIAVVSSLDNLVKGAAGQAVQNLNIMMGWEETAGLESAGLYP